MSQDENNNQKDSMVILHISDLHFGIADEKNLSVRYIAGRQEEMIDSLINTISAIAKESPEWKPDIIAVSGDIAWTGKPEEYDLYIKKFVNPICEVLNIGRDRIITCPGNHDIIRDNVYRVNRYQRGMNGIDADVPDLTIEQINKQAYFFEGYVEKLLGGNGKDLCKKYEFSEWPWATFVTLNSAWDCRNDDDQGRLRVGLPILEDILRDVKDQWVITLFHHPHIEVWDNERLADGEYEARRCRWLHDSEDFNQNRKKRVFASYVSDKSCIILNGHIHVEIEPQLIQRALHFIDGTIYSNDTLQYHCRLIKLDSKGGTASYRNLRRTLGSNDRIWENTGGKTLELFHPDVVKTKEEQKQMDYENNNMNLIRTTIMELLSKTISPTDEFNHKRSMVAGENMEMKEEHVLNLRKGDDK